MIDEPLFERRDSMATRPITLKNACLGSLESVEDLDELSQLVLHWSPNGSVSRVTDIGRFCFYLRKGTGTKASVDPRSLIRHDLLRNVVLGTIKSLTNRPDSSTPTCLGHLTLLLHADTDHDLRTAGDIFRSLVGMLRAQLENGDRAANTLVNTQNIAIDVLSLGFGVSRDSVVRGVPMLSQKKHSARETREFSQEAGAKIAQAAKDHFLEVAKALILGESLPFEICVNDRRYLVTARASAYGKAERYEELDESGNPSPDSVYGPGLELRKLPAARPGTSRPEKEVRQIRRRYGAVQKERRRLDKANASQDSKLRLLLATEALLSFAVYSYFDTGANASALQGRIIGGEQRDAILVSQIIHENGELLVVSDRGAKSYVLDTEKARAGNIRVPIVFSSIWVKRVFPVYLEFREYLSGLGIEVPDNLVFLISAGRDEHCRIDTFPSICTRLRQVRGHILNRLLSEYGFQSITTRQIRNYKSVSISRVHGPSASANLLGHSLKTALEHYNRIEEQEAQLQLSGAFNHVLSIAKVDPHDTSSARLPGGGACTKSAEDLPVAVSSEEFGLHAPSCRTRTGCWLCPHFAVHADKEDLWKMKSYSFVINELRMSSVDQIGVAMIHKPILDRIENLCNQIMSVSPDLAEISHEIDRQIEIGNLHPIYESLLEIYEEANLV